MNEQIKLQGYLLQIEKTSVIRNSLIILMTIVMLTVSSISFAEKNLPRKVNINTANAEEIEVLLVGIGASKAKAIIAYREQNGPFIKLEDIARVKGIGMKTLQKNQAYIIFK